MLPDFARNFPDLASTKVSGRVVFATDDFFAEAENMLMPTEPVFIGGKYTEFGKWMDGWETRRKRTPGHDWSIVKLGLSGNILGVEVDTCFFTGNYVPKVSIQAAFIEKELDLGRKSSNLGSRATDEQMQAALAVGSHLWDTVIPMSPLQSGVPETRRTFLAVPEEFCGRRYNYVRINMFPDGGIARLRVHGIVSRDWSSVSRESVIDLISVENGGRALAFSDAHYGHPRNLIGPGTAENMGDGWETARRKDRPAIYEVGADGCLVLPGYEWALLALGHVGIVEKIIVETHHFKGNFPESFLLEGRLSDANVRDERDIASSESSSWVPIVVRSKLQADSVHSFVSVYSQPISHVRLTMYPDGGISRLRLFGRIFFY